MDYSVQKNPTNPERFYVMDDGGTIVAQGSYKGRGDDDIIKAATGVGMAKDLADAKDSKGIQLPQNITAIKEAAMGPQGGDMKQREKMLGLYEKLRDDFMKTSGIDPKVDAQKKGVVDAVFKQLARLEDIETSPDRSNQGTFGRILGGIEGLGRGAIQEIGGMTGIDEDVTAYKQAQDQLKIPMLRKILGEVGATMTAEQEAAKSLFPSGPGLYMGHTRPELLENTFSNLQAISGVNLRDAIEKIDPGIFERIGAYPSDSPNLLERKWQKKVVPQSQGAGGLEGLSDEELLKMAGGQ